MRRFREAAQGAAVAVTGLVLLGGCMAAPETAPPPTADAPEVPGGTASARPAVTPDLACDDLRTGFSDAPVRSADASLGGPGGDDVFTAQCVWSVADAEDAAENVDLEDAEELPGTVSALAMGSGETSFAELRDDARQDAEDDGATTFRATDDQLSFVETGGEVVRAEVMLPTTWGYVSCTWTAAAPPAPEEPVVVVGELCRDFRELAVRTRTDAVAARGR